MFFFLSDVTYQYDTVFWLGDLNFRLAVNRDHVFEKLKDKKSDTYQHLMQWDQLSQARRKGECDEGLTSLAYSVICEYLECKHCKHLQPQQK